MLGAARVRVRENEWENVLYIINGIIHICTKQQKEVNHMKAQSQQKKEKQTRKQIYQFSESTINFYTRWMG